MKQFFFILGVCIFFLLTPPAFAQTSTSPDFSLEIGVTPKPPTPTPFISHSQSGFPDEQNAKPMRLTISADSIDYGPMNPTNPIKRKITVSVDPGSSPAFSLFLSQNHPLSLCHPEQREGSLSSSEKNPAFAGDSSAAPQNDSNCQEIPNTTCDNGACTEKTPALWNNPFTFGFGFSLDDSNYRQFPTSSQNESTHDLTVGVSSRNRDQPPTAISPGDLFVKVNTSPKEQQKEDEFYQNTLLFLLLPKL